MNLCEIGAEDVVARVYEAQRHHGVFYGDALASVATKVGKLARAQGWELVGVDESGQRMIGVASVAGGAIVADISRRIDGDVLLVAGLLAGPYGVISVASRIRSLGARTVHLAYLGGWQGSVPGVDSVVLLARSESLQAPAGRHQATFVPAHSNETGCVAAGFWPTPDHA